MMNLIKVNGEDVPVSHALGWASFLGGPDLRGFAVEQLAIKQMAQSRQLGASADELKELFVELRYAQRLESGEALRTWMADNAITADMMSEACAQLVYRRKLRESIQQDDIERHYAENRPSFDLAELYRIVVEDPDLAHEIQALVLDEDESFCLLAMQHSVDQDTSQMGGYLGEVGRGEFPGEVEAIVFGARPGDVVGPVKTDSGWELLLVHDMRSRPLEDVWDEIRDDLFQEMIDAAVSRARLEIG